MMNLVRTTLKSRAWLVVGAFLLVAASAAVLTPQEAGADRCGTEFTYYDNYGNVVGYRAWLDYECNCEVISWGVTTWNREIGDSWCWASP
jgi:hypothetical protein